MPGRDVLDGRELGLQRHRRARARSRRGPRAAAPATGRRRRCPGAPGRSAPRAWSASPPSWPGAAPRGAPPAPSTVPTASANTSAWSLTVGCSGSSANAKWHQSPTTSTAPPPAARRTSGRSAARSPGMSPLRPRPVSTLRWTRAVRPVARAAAASSSRAHGAETETSTSASTRLAQGRAGRVQPGEDPRVGDPPAPQRQRLVHLRGAEPGRAAGQRGAGGRQEPVPVAVGLDDGHDLGGRCVGGQ